MERAGKTFVQQFVIMLFASGQGALLHHQDWVVSADTAGFAAILSLLSTYSLIGVDWESKPWADAIARVVKTGLQSFVATLAASQVTSVVHADWQGALAVALPVTLLAAMTALLGVAMPDTVGAGFLPLDPARAAHPRHAADADQSVPLGVTAGEPVDVAHQLPTSGGT